MDALFLTLDEVREIHEQQIERYGGEAGVRDPEFVGVEREVELDPAELLKRLERFLEGSPSSVQRQG